MTHTCENKMEQEVAYLISDNSSTESFKYDLGTPTLLIKVFTKLTNKYFSANIASRLQITLCILSIYGQPM